MQQIGGSPAVIDRRYSLTSLSRTTGEPQRAAGEFTVIEACGFVHQGQPLGQSNAKSPLVFTAAGFLPVASPVVPPRCKAPRNGFDHENRRTILRSVHEFFPKALTNCSVELVYGERRY